MTHNEARDAMLGVFLAVWTPLGFAATYTDVPAVPPGTQKVWARVTVRHAPTGGLRSLTGGLGTAMYERKGTLWIAVFAPPGDGSVAGYDAAQAVENAYQSARLSVWFRNVRMEEMGNDKGYERFDVKCDFEYTDVR